MCRTRRMCRVSSISGTGSGAIALALAFERPDVEVWATDVSTDALEVARANLAGLGRAGTRVQSARRARGSRRYPTTFEVQFDVVVSNPPYIADAEWLPPEVDDWEPRSALRSGPTGTEAYDRHRRAGAWRGSRAAAASCSSSLRTKSTTSSEQWRDRGLRRRRGPPGPGRTATGAGRLAGPSEVR